MPLPQIRNFNLKVIFLAHFIFISLSSFGEWNPNAYLFYNLIFILLLIISIYFEQNQEALQLAIAVNGASIVLDILLLILCYPYSDRAREKLSAAMCILHLIIRPCSGYVQLKILEDRAGASGSLTGLFSGTRDGSYEDIDRNRQPQTSAHVDGHDFSTAQQI